MSLRGKIERNTLKRLLALVTEDSQPNLNLLNDVVKNIRILELNVKAMGYELARSLAAALPIPEGTLARHVGLASKAAVQADMESDWAAHWAAELHAPVVYHRKLWELVYILQALHEHGLLAPGRRGLGFGCGAEPIPSYLAARGVSVTATDLPVAAAYEAGWVETGQHLDPAGVVHHSALLTREEFDCLVELRTVDMNAIPDDLAGYDFCWSACALEHLGSIEQGLAFVEASLKTLRPGGLAVHTMEFNVENDGPTIDNWATVLFQRRHIEDLAARLAAEGHVLATPDFSYGHQPMDRFIDVPPWRHDAAEGNFSVPGPEAHLKLAIDGFISTSFGIIVHKAGGTPGGESL